MGNRHRLLARKRLRRFSILAALFGSQMSLVVVALISDRLGDHPLTLVVLPLAVASVMFGVRGAVTMGLATSALTVVWWTSKNQPGGEMWLVSRTLSFVAVALVLGRLADSRARLLRRLENHNDLSLDLIATASFDGYFTKLNPAFTKTLGFSAEELMERPLLEFVHPDDRAPTLAAIQEQTELGQSVFHFQNRYLTSDGSYRWLEWTSRPDARENELVAVARDVTERKRFEALEREHTQRLERAVKERTEELQAKNKDLADSRLETLQRLALAAEYRDDDTHHHTTRVGRTAALIAAQLGLPEEFVELIRLAAPLHDVGKIAVSDTILLKPGRLTTGEFRQMQEHVRAGARLLAGSRSEILQLAQEIALTHHERWDGTGYPKMLRGEEIPVSGRITAIADVFDALTHDRPYKVAWPVQHAVAEINRLGGRQFDPQLVAAFTALDHQSLLDVPPERRLAIVA
jgi:PAS domain S-box-containing protein